MTDTRSNGPQPTVTIKENTVEDRFELYVNGMPAGILGYEKTDENYALTHTEIDPEFEGQGMGSKLITLALENIRQQGLGVLPYCPFVQSFIIRHTEYLDLVPQKYRRRFELAGS